MKRRHANNYSRHLILQLEYSPSREISGTPKAIWEASVKPANPAAMDFRTPFSALSELVFVCDGPRLGVVVNAAAPEANSANDDRAKCFII